MVEYGQVVRIRHARLRGEGRVEWNDVGIEAGEDWVSDLGEVGVRTNAVLDPDYMCQRSCPLWTNAKFIHCLLRLISFLFSTTSCTDEDEPTDGEILLTNCQALIHQIY